MAAFSQLTLLVKQEGGRYFLDWGIETNTDTCVHGIKSLWVCDECAELYERATDIKEGENLQHTTEQVQTSV